MTPTSIGRKRIHNKTKKISSMCDLCSYGTPSDLGMWSLGKIREMVVGS